MLVAALVILGIAAFIAWKGHEKYKVNADASREIRELHDEADRLKRETSKLSDRLEYLRTPEFQERQVKDTLGLAKPDEKLVIIKPNAFEKPAEGMGDTGAQSDQRAASLEPNYKKWWKYFFAP